MAVSLSKLLGASFLCVLLVTMVFNFGMFLKRHGRRHALNGLCYFIWLCSGFMMFIFDIHFIPYVFFDSILGCLGISLALSAVCDFQHKNIVNIASGVLDEHATVTYNEMIEHSFYQGVNLIQVLYLHTLSSTMDMKWRYVSAFLVTSPWLFRSTFPINRFSDNYNKPDNKSSTFIKTMYRIKKYQYIFYKHFLLHGLNLSMAITGRALADQDDFRLYWMFLNISYVMDFFLQTLVKKKYITQKLMLDLQMVLMTASTIAALYVLQYVHLVVALASLVLNFTNRGHDVFNSMLVLTGYLVLQFISFSD